MVPRRYRECTETLSHLPPRPRMVRSLACLSLIFNLHFSDPSPHPSACRRIYALSAAPLLQCE